MHEKLREALVAAGLEPEYQVAGTENYRCACPNCGSHDNLNVRWNARKKRIEAHCWSCGSNSLYAEKTRIVRRKKPFDTAATPVKTAVRNPDARCVKTYEYTDDEGKAWVRKLRYEPALVATAPDGTFAKKDFFFKYRKEVVAKNTGNLFVTWGGRPQGFDRNFLYAYPRVIETVANGGIIFLVDGEKDADALNAAESSDCATCCPFGDRAFPPWAVEQLAGAKIVVIADKDQTGYKSALAKAKLLRKQTCAIAVAAVGKDTYDHYASGGTYRTMYKLPVAELIKRAEGK